jgi:hypothetical protein
LRRPFIIKIRKVVHLLEKHLVEQEMKVDNINSTKLEMNRTTSAGKQTCHLDIKYFYIIDLIERKEVTIKYCPTDATLTGYFMK